MTSTSKPRALISAGVLLVAAATSPDVLAAMQEPPAAGPAEEPAEPPPAAPPEAPVTEAPAAEAPAAEPAAPAGPAVSAGASAGTSGVGVGGKAAAPKASKKRGRQPPDGVVLDEKKNKVRDTRKWIHRYSPERHLFEIGAFGGVYLPPEDHDLFQPFSEPMGLKDPQRPLWRMSAQVGARLAYFPLRFLGIEGEFSAMPTRVRNIRNDSAFVYGLRGHVVLQLPYRITPFLLGGYGMLGISSERQGLGRDIDPAGHYGAGLKIFINRLLMFRMDMRHIFSAQAHLLKPEFTSHFEANVGLSLVLGRVRPKPAPKDLDWDKDGIQNDVDQCPKLAGLPPDGCPAIDSDEDSFLDKVDKCPFEAGVAPDGCPPPDRDKDGVIDPEDECPDEPGLPPKGCPPPKDSDGDGFIDEVDKCPLHPETDNGFEDDDGCPDTLPKPAEDYKGKIDGIFFEFRSDKIKKNSVKTLDRAVAVLKEFPSIKIEISGHTDDVGTREFNLDLSQRRADSVKKYLVDHGIEESRIRTIGYGPDKPLDPAKTSKARALNRRIEFRILLRSDLNPGSAPPAGETSATPPAGEAKPPG